MLESLSLIILQKRNSPNNLEQCQLKKLRNLKCP
jgi:hypothetical protein